jgi:ATP-binding cassette, subfamily B, bacterial
MSMGQGMSTWHAVRSFRQDSSVTKKKLAPGTVKRIIKFAAPYKAWIIILLVLLVIDAALGTVTPLLIREILNQGIGSTGHAARPHLVIGVAIVIALIAVVDAGLGLIERYYSSRIGEGLIFDMRAKIFGHIQRMPIAFFTRTQTGALISRLNNDVLGAQQAFTGTLSSVQPVVADHAGSAGVVAGVRVAGALVRPQAADHHP